MGKFLTRNKLLEINASQAQEIGELRERVAHLLRHVRDLGVRVDAKLVDLKAILTDGRDTRP